ncbi:MAG: hypothetical protein C0478_12955 [Planctomyces sp.]|nr:hypothetical protein [Planctomyces sp.]
MDDAEAFELIDAHLDRHPLTDEQSDALTAWIKADPRHADDAFYRIFLHSYLRLRLQAGLPTSDELSLLPEGAHSGDSDTRWSIAKIRSEEVREVSLAILPAQQEIADDTAATPRWRRRHFVLITCGLVLLAASFYGWRGFGTSLGATGHVLYVEESFDYSATPLTKSATGSLEWPTTGGLQGLNGGGGWSEPWRETDSKVAIIADYTGDEFPWEPKDMRKYGPLGYTDAAGRVLKSSGRQLRTATRPRSVTTRKFDIPKFPQAMRDEAGLGADGAVVWLSFLAQSSLSTADNNRYSYLLIGSKEVAGLRIGKLGAAPSGNWTAVALQTEAEVNLKTSAIPSGEMVFLVTRIIFRPGPEEAVVWINPRLEEEPEVSGAALRLTIPDFRFDGISIRANHSTDFDEIRLGNTFQAVAPTAN